MFQINLKQQPPKTSIDSLFRLIRSCHCYQEQRKRRKISVADTPSLHEIHWTSLAGLCSLRTPSECSCSKTVLVVSCWWFVVAYYWLLLLISGVVVDCCWLVVVSRFQLQLLNGATCRKQLDRLQEAQQCGQLGKQSNMQQVNSSYFGEIKQLPTVSHICSAQTVHARSMPVTAALATRKLRVFLGIGEWFHTLPKSQQTRSDTQQKWSTFQIVALLFGMVSLLGSRYNAVYHTVESIWNRIYISRVRPSYRMYILLFASHGVTGKM